jgi:AAA family ATP:ADP antiporter
MLLLTSFIFNSVAMLDTRANIDSKITDLRVFALEVLDNLLTAEIKEIVIPMLDELSAAERLSKLSERFPQQSLSPNGRFDDIVSNHFEETFYWTRATLLYLIGTNKLEKHIGVVQSSLTHSEPVVRETALWALAQLSPPDIKRTLTAHADDSSNDVRRVVDELLSNLAEPV